MAVSSVKRDSEFIDNEIDNVQSDTIRITEDKLFRKLKGCIHCLSHQYDWIGALGIVLTITLALFTANFKDAFGLSSVEWAMVFKIADFAAIIYLIYVAYKNYKNRMTVDDVIKTIKS